MPYLQNKAITKTTSEVAKRHARGGAGFVCNVHDSPSNLLSTNLLQAQQSAKIAPAVSQSSQTTYPPGPGGPSPCSPTHTTTHNPRK